METAITYLTTLNISICSDVRPWQSINTHTYIQASCVLHTWMCMCYLSQTLSGYKTKRGEYQSNWSWRISTSRLPLGQSKVPGLHCFATQPAEQHYLCLCTISHQPGSVHHSQTHPKSLGTSFWYGIGLVSRKHDLSKALGQHQPPSLHVYPHLRVADRGVTTYY